MELSTHMAGIEVAWWLLFFAAFGLCVGSFLNVVIFRVPRDISLSDPLWSFCPGCHRRIAWYDNLPLISYLRLGGRCRQCRTTIAPRYPLVEILGALTAVILFDAFFIAHTHAGIGQYFADTTVRLGVTWQLSEDWPIYLAHVVLFAALLAMSAIDIEHYWVDVRFTWFATGAGFVLHSAWMPRHQDTWYRPTDNVGAAALVATAALAVTALLLSRRQVHAEDNPIEDENPPADAATFAPIFAGAPGATIDDDAQPDDEPSSVASGLARLARPVVWVAGILLAVLLVGAWSNVTAIGPQLSPITRWIGVLVLLFLLIVAGGMPRRDSDHAIIAAIEAERHSARRVALGELLMLLPAIVLGGLVWYWASSDATASTRLSEWLAWSPIRNWHPVSGLATAATGFIIGGGIGWFVRIAATLVMGREAFGTGDIHMMAAAGCVAGWPVVLMGFVLCSLLALAGWLLLAPFKRARAIPLGPWLSIAFLIVVVLYGPILRWQPVRNVVAVFGDPAATIQNITGHRQLFTPKSN